MMTALDRVTDTRSRTNGVQDHEAGLDPELLGLAERMSKYTAASGVVSPKLKELVQIKVAAMVGCPF